MSSQQQRSKRQLQANGSGNRLSADVSSKSRFGSGLVSLGGAPKSKTTTVGGKLAAPPPVNLPSLRKEHAGNDPNAQLVASSQGWNSKQPEQPPALSNSSHWASSSGRTREGQVADPRFSNADYPSLQAAARSGSTSHAAPRVDHTRYAGRSWEDDERGGPPSRPPPPPPGRPASPSWNQNEAATPSNRHWRDAEPVRRRWDDPPERWGHREPDRWEGSDRRRPPPEYAPSVLLRDDLDDATLFPPAPTRPMASVSDGADSTNAEEDPERAAFEQELERLASQLHKQREGVVDVPPLPDPLAAAPAPPSRTPPSEQTLAARHAARQQEAEQEHTRKQAAARKLRALEERMAARQADPAERDARGDNNQGTPSPEAPPSPYAFGTNLVEEVTSLSQLQLDAGDANDAGDLLGALPADLYLDTPPGSLAPQSHMQVAAAQYGSAFRSGATYEEPGLFLGAGGMWQQPTYSPGLFGVQSPIAQQVPMGDGVLGQPFGQPFVQTHLQPDWSMAGRPQQ